MYQRAVLAAVVSSLALCAAPRLPQAEAEVMATGTRLSVAGGPVRSYMTYGHIADPELYAPIIPELAKVQVTFQRQGENLDVFYKGAKVDTWPLVYNRNEVPESGDCALFIGGAICVPVKAIAERFSLDIKWDKGANLIALTPNQKKPIVSTAPQNTGVREGLVALTGIHVEQKNGTFVVKVESAEPVSPQWLTVNSAPRRVVFDFAKSQWADGVQAPGSIGEVRQARIGYPTPTTARLVFEVPSPQFKITAVVVTETGLVATLGPGAETKRMIVTKEAMIRLALKKRGTITAKTSRGGTTPDGNYVIPMGGLDDPMLFREPTTPDITSVVPRNNLDEPRIRPTGSLRGKVIVVDAGHGGHSSGALGLNNQEKDLCLKMSRELQASLEELGAQVIMTRSSDVYVSLDDRCRIANQSNAHIFISIHCNSMPRRNMQSGSESYWHSSEKSALLARCLHPYLVRSVAGRDGGVRNRSFQVIRETNMPSVLLEIAYINNTTDEILLSNGDFHKRLADNLARGVLNYFGTTSASN